MLGAAAHGLPQLILPQAADHFRNARALNMAGAGLSLQPAQQTVELIAASLGRLLASVEAYPDLKSNQNFLALQSQLEGTENRINVSIKDYNTAVQAYNTTIRTFPDAIGAKIFYGAKPMTTYEATAPNADRAPTVKF